MGRKLSKPVAVSSTSLRSLRLLRLLGRASSYSRSVPDVDRSFHRTELRPFPEFLVFARPPRNDASPCGEPWPREGRCSCWLNRFRKPQR
jgi:hypothetical protein